MGGGESKFIPTKTEFYVADHGDKYKNLGGISAGFFVAWLIIGTILALYVRW